MLDDYDDDDDDADTCSAAVLGAGPASATTAACRWPVDLIT